MSYSRKSAQQNSILAKIMHSIFFLLFLAAGCFFEWLMIQSLLEEMAVNNWDKVPCTITASNISTARHDYVLDIKYTYTYNDREYTGSKYGLKDKKKLSYSKISKITAALPVNAATQCYVNPTNPQMAVLKKASTAGKFAELLFPMIFITIGAGGIYFIWRKKEPTIKKQVSLTKKGKTKPWLAYVLFGIFAIVGTAMFIFLTVKPLTTLYQSQSWTATPCKIISARVQRHTGNKSTTYSVDILYEYQVNGKPYRNNRYNFISGSSSGSSGKRDIVNKYKHMTNPVCYVNPEKPNSAVLTNDLSKSYFICLIPLPFMLIGYGGFTHLILRNRRKSKQNQQLKTVSDCDSYSHEPLQLKTTSPIKKFAIVLLIATFWNTIIAVLAIEPSAPSIFIRIFLIPFYIIGLALIIFSLHSLLQCFNPRIQLTISPGTISLGSSCQLSWRIFGRSSRVNNLTIKLIGQEEATYQRGTKTRTDKHKFYSDQLLSSEDSFEIREGSIGFIMPENTIHTFIADNNKIVWQLEVHGDIKRWPDIKQKFKITVEPLSKDRS